MSCAWMGGLDETINQLAYDVFSRIGFDKIALSLVGKLGFKDAVACAEKLTHDALRTGLYNGIIDEGADKSKSAQFKRLDAIAEKRMGNKHYARWEDVSRCSMLIQLIVNVIKYIFRWVVFYLFGKHIEDVANTVFWRLLRAPPSRT